MVVDEVGLITPFTAIFRILEIDSKRGHITLRNPKKKDEDPREYTFDAVYDST